MQAPPRVPFGKQAVVIGASMAGLLSARVLADHFESVTVLERDPLPEEPQARKGVPQGHHTHGLLQTGAEVLAQLFPGFWEELVAAGATLMDTGRDWHWFHYGTWKAHTPSAPLMYGQSRPFLEHHVRRRLRQDCPRVRLVTADVTDLVQDDQRQQVTGVRLRQQAQPPSTLEAELVVDASGRGTRSPRWLEELGYGRPPEEHVHIDLCYASRIVELSAQQARGWKALLVYGTPPFQKRNGTLFPIEGGRWIATLAGCHGDHPPADEQGMLEYSRSLCHPEHHEALRQARPLTPIALFKTPSNQRYRYERMKRLPDGYAVVGDAVCSLNPIFGQGVTLAALGALTLGQCLTDRAPGQLQGLSRDFQQRTARFNDVAWMLATTEDLRFPETRGARPPGLSLLNGYKSQLMALSSVDADVHRRFLQVVHMKAGAQALLAPTLLLKALTWSLGLRPPAPAR